MPWTIEYDETTQSLEAWGLAGDVRLLRGNQVPDSLTLRAPVPMDGTLQFDHGEPVIVYRPDDTIYFSGKVSGVQRFGSGASEYITYEIAGPWFDLEQLVFQQPWKWYNGNPESLETVYTSELCLGQTITGTKQTSGAQVVEVLDWAIARGVNLQKGTIDAAADIPIYPVRDMTCAEVIRQMLRWTNDVAWFDYTTDPPTFHARKLSNLSTIGMAVSDGVMSQILLRPRYDLQIPCVLIRYRQVNEVDGTSWLEVGTDKYPGGGTGLEIGASVHTIELVGLNATTVQSTVHTQTVYAQSVTDATRVNWWKTKLPWLKSANINNISVTSATVKNPDTLEDITLATYPYELIKGQVCPWMSKSSVPALIEAMVSYDKFVAGATVVPISKPIEAPVSCKIMLTDAQTGTYSSMSSFTGGEAAPVGLAQHIYEGRSTLQYDGEIDLAGAEVISGLLVGKKLTVTGLGVTIADQMIQEVIDEPMNGRQRVRFGPPGQIGVTDLIELLRVNRYRLTFFSPSQRVTAKSDDGGSRVVLGTGGGENSVSDITGAKLHAVHYDLGSSEQGIVRLDAENMSHYVGKVNASTGAVITGGSVWVKVEDCDGRDLAVREFHFMDKDTCVEQKMWIIASSPEAA